MQAGRATRVYMLSIPGKPGLPEVVLRPLVQLAGEMYAQGAADGACLQVAASFIRGQLVLVGEVAETFTDDVMWGEIGKLILIFAASVQCTTDVYANVNGTTWTYRYSPD